MCSTQMIIIKEILDRKEIIKDGKEVVMFYISYDGRSGLNHANVFIPIEFANTITVGKRIRLKNDNI